MAGPRMHTLQGVSRVVVKRLDMDENGARFHMEVVWHESGEVDEHLKALGSSNIPVCWMLVGYASGYASFVLDRNVFFIEEKCRGMGHRVCKAS